MFQDTDLVPKLFSNSFAVCISHVFRYLLPLSHLASESFHLSPKTSTSYHSAGTQPLWPMFCPGPGWFIQSKMRGEEESETEHSWNQTNNESINNCNERTFKKLSILAESHKSLVSKLDKYFLLIKRKGQIYLGILFGEAESLIKVPILIFTPADTKHKYFCWSQWKGQRLYKGEEKPQAFPMWLKFSKCLPFSKSVSAELFSKNHAQLYFNCLKNIFWPSIPHGPLICLHSCLGF